MTGPARVARAYAESQAALLRGNIARDLSDLGDRVARARQAATAGQQLPSWTAKAIAEAARDLQTAAARLEDVNTLLTMLEEK